MSIERLGIEFLSVFGLPPLEFVDLVADLGCHYLSMGLGRMPDGPYGYAPFSLRDDPALRGAMLVAMEERGVAISLGEGFGIRPEADADDLAADLDIMAGLGAPRVNTVGLDPDRSRCFDQFGVLVEMAAERGMETTLEFGPGLACDDLRSAMDAIHHVGRVEFRLLIDTMHFIRSGSTPADLAVLDSGLIGYVQLSDVPLVPTNPNYRQEAMGERMVPGEGELPLLEILRAVPDDLVVGIEVPNRTEASSSESPEAWVRQCVSAARDLLE